MPSRLGGVNTTLIDRNTTIPANKSQTFSTAVDNQTAVTIRVLQGERPMANDNVELGRFDLLGIPLAPRGLPQIEVSFDIDANGIVHVSAKDLGTGKEQSIRITAPKKLGKDDIDRMVREAEKFAAEDAKKKEEVEAINHADTLVYTTEKSLRDYGDKISQQERGEIENAINDLKQASSYQSPLRYLRERSQVPNLDRRLGLRARCHRQNAAQPLGNPL